MVEKVAASCAALNLGIFPGVRGISVRMSVMGYVVEPDGHNSMHGWVGK